MNCIATSLQGCFVLEPKIIGDERGSFMESFNQRLFAELTENEVHFVQDNQSISSKNVVRGLHYQTGDHAQAKLVRVLQGEVLDVALDIRPESKTYGQHFAVLLSGENNRQLFVPRGFAHGFSVLSEKAVFLYKCDNFYDRASEGGILYNDPELQIDWKVAPELAIVSEKDQQLPKFQNARKVW